MGNSLEGARRTDQGSHGAKPTAGLKYRRPAYQSGFKPIPLREPRLPLIQPAMSAVDQAGSGHGRHPRRDQGRTRTWLRAKAASLTSGELAPLPGIGLGRWTGLLPGPPARIDHAESRSDRHSGSSDDYRIGREAILRKPVISRLGRAHGRDRALSRTRPFSVEVFVIDRGCRACGIRQSCRRA